MRKVEAGTNERGFAYIEFEDKNRQECSLQLSSAADEESIWLGCTTGVHYDVNTRVTELPSDSVNKCLARMHLTRTQAAWLARQLRHFVKHGEIELV